MPQIDSAVLNMTMTPEEAKVKKVIPCVQRILESVT